MGFGWQEIDKNLDLGYIRVAGLHRRCKSAVLFDPPNFCPRTMTHIRMYVRTYIYVLCREWSVSCLELYLESCHVPAGSTANMMLLF